MNTEWNNAYKKRPYLEQEPNKGVVQFINHLSKEKSKRILDLGCGDGRHLIWLTKQGFDSVGVDNALWGLYRAKEWAEKESLNIKLVYADIAFLPMKNESFDEIISIQVIHHQRIKKIEKTIKDIRRLLQPNGKFYFTVPQYPPGNWKNGKYTEIEPHTFVPLEGFEKGVPHHLFIADELAKMLDSFEILEIKIDPDTGRHLSALVRKPMLRENRGQLIPR